MNRVVLVIGLITVSVLGVTAIFQGAQRIVARDAEPSLCQRLGDAIRPQLEIERASLDTSDAVTAAAFNDFDKGMVWIERGCSDDGTGGEMVPKLLESLRSSTPESFAPAPRHEQEP